MKKTGKYTIEDFIFNQELVDLVKKGDQAGIDLFLSKFPDANDFRCCCSVEKFED